MRAYNGQQPGAPLRAVIAIVNAAESCDIPPRLLLGKAALADARKKVDMLSKNSGAWAELNGAADFPQQA